MSNPTKYTFSLPRSPFFRRIQRIALDTQMPVSLSLLGGRVYHVRSNDVRYCQTKFFWRLLTAEEKGICY